MKQVELYKGRTVNAYTDADLSQFVGAVRNAKAKWQELCLADFNANGDRGTCVLGAGIYVWYIAPRCRKPSKHFLIRSNAVASCQGSVNWEGSKNEIMGMLSAEGLCVEYEWGNAD